MVKSVVLGNVDDCVWEFDNECEFNVVVEWFFDVEESDYVIIFDIN